MKKFPNNPVHLYSRVGRPELVFFVNLTAVVFLPFIFNLDDSVIPQILITLFIFSLQYLINSSESRIKKFLNSLLLFILAVIWIQYFKDIIPFYILNISEIVLMIISFYFISKSIFYSTTVDINTLIAAIAGYLLIGISMGLLVFIMQKIHSDSFSFAGKVTTFDTNYYSFVTMSTLGYGDILPLSKNAKGLSIIITLLGQFYMVIVMGLIIGKMLSPKEKNK